MHMTSHRNYSKLWGVVEGKQYIKLDQQVATT